MSEAFADLPDALVRDLLAQATSVAEHVSGHLRRLREVREPVRTRLTQSGLIARKADLDVTREPSVVGIDGSYQAHRLTAVDLCAFAFKEGDKGNAKIRPWVVFHKPNLRRTG